MEKDNKLTVISIILALICLGILGYIVYFKVNKKVVEPEAKPPVNQQIATATDEPEVVEEKKDLSKETIRKLYAIIGDNPEFRYEDVVTYETLSENVRDSIVLNSLEETCKDTSVYEKEYFLLKYKEIFNVSKESDEGLCKLVDGSYECNRYCSEFGPSVYHEFVKSEIEDGLLVIYETAGHFEYLDDGKIYLKADASDDLAIASFNTIEEFENSSKGYKLPTYKHIFKNNDGKYYWSSSEIVNE